MKSIIFYSIVFIVSSCAKDQTSNTAQYCPLTKSDCIWWAISGVNLLPANFYNLQYTTFFIDASTTLQDSKFTEYNLEFNLDFVDGVKDYVVTNATFKIEGISLDFVTGAFHVIDRTDKFNRGTFSFVFYDPIQKREYEITDGVVHQKY